MLIENITSLQTLARVFDVILVSAIIYTILILVRGTRAQPMLLGLGMVVLVYFLSRHFNFVVLYWLLSNFLSSVILLVVVLFQDDLRRALTKVGLLSGFANDSDINIEERLNSVVNATSSLASREIGAIIVLQQEVGLGDYTEHAVEVDALVSKQLLEAIFLPSSPIHDGAVIISGERIVAAGAVLPLTFSAQINEDLGTRHRAAIGLSERTDAVVLVVSEETGQISLVRDGKITRDIGESNLLKALSGLTVKKNNDRKGLFFWKKKLNPKEIVAKDSEMSVRPGAEKVGDKVEDSNLSV